MLIDETNEELLDRIESIVYILVERMGAEVAQSVIEDVVSNAVSDHVMESRHG